MRRSFIHCNAMFILVFWGILFVAPEGHCQTRSLPEPWAGIEGPDRAVAQKGTGYVDMQNGEAGDRFVDEDGDGLDDRHLKRHQKRKQQRYRGDTGKGSSQEYGEKGSGGQQGHHGGGPTRGPDRGEK